MATLLIICHVVSAADNNAGNAADNNVGNDADNNGAMANYIVAINGQDKTH